MHSLTTNNLSKTFNIYSCPIDRLKELLFRRSYHRQFEALCNVSFSLLAGESLGIIGSNGAGKSTVLKILAGTLSPSAGELKIHGRVAALLELGAGFHGEFTGRQNIYLNAALLGMNDKEIRQKEQSIIDFAELGDFIDQPVKTYSSGMTVRLGFSIATSVDPDILIIDEALSVGDQRFQKKCIDRMMHFKNSGKIIIFCSHSMYHVEILCSKAVWLEKGRVKMLGESGRVIQAYDNWAKEQSKTYADDIEKVTNKVDESIEVPCFVDNVTLTDEHGELLSKISPFSNVRLCMNVEAMDDLSVHFGFAILRNDDLMCFCSLTSAEFSEFQLNRGEHYKVILDLSDLSLLNGCYRVMGGVADEYGLHLHHTKLSDPFDIVSDSHLGYGIVTFPQKWQIDQS